MMPLDPATWSAIDEFARTKIKEAQEALSVPGLAEREADLHRGRILAFNEILNLRSPEPEVARDVDLLD